MRPEPAPLRLRVRIAGEEHDAGLAHDADFFHADLAHAGRTLDQMVAQTLLQPRDARATTLQFTYDTPESWRSFLSRPRGGRLEANDELIERALASMPRGDAAIVAEVDHRACAYERP